MEKENKNKMDLIKDKKLFHADKGTEIIFKELWTELQPDQLVFITFFRFWG